MDIKLKVKIGAYAKAPLSTVWNTPIIPIPGCDDAGKVLGVGCEGAYDLFNSIPDSKINELFEGGE